MNCFGPAGIKMNEYRHDAPEAESVDVMVRFIVAGEIFTQ